MCINTNGMHSVFSKSWFIYRVIHDLWTLLQEVISQVFVIKKVNIKFVRFWMVKELWALFSSRTRPRVNRVLGNSWW